MLKHSLRMVLGRALKTAGLSEHVRKIYFHFGQQYLKELHGLQGAWFRRSIATQDFVPVISDIDLTLLLNREEIERLYSSKQLSQRPALMQDIQLLYRPFLARWQRTGGIRNRQMKKWIPAIPGPAISPPTEKQKSVIAFELAHELYLLYKQLAPKIGWPTRDESSKKLFYEVNRLIQYWKIGDENLLIDPRQNFIFDQKEETNFYHQLDQLCKELLGNVDPILSGVDPDRLMLETGNDWTRLNYKMENRFVTVVSPENQSRIASQFRNDFVTTRSFVALILGTGVHAQPQLNQLAWRESGYYRDYCTQRLAHDLVGSILLNPRNSRQLYFCFQNIQEFLAGFNGLEAYGWSEVSSWSESKPFPLSDKEILEKTFRNLELLDSIR